MVTAVVLHLVGAGGFRTGFVAVFVILASVTAVVAWVTLGPRPDRALWLAVLVVLAATAAGLLVDNAPPSKARLVADLDGKVPPFFTVAEVTTSGRSWCRPHCPRASVTLYPPATATQAIMVPIAAEFVAAGLLDETGLQRIVYEESFRVTGDDVVYDVSIRPGNEQAKRIVVMTAASR